MMRANLSVLSAFDSLHSLLCDGGAGCVRRAPCRIRSVAIALAFTIAVLLPTSLRAMSPLQQDVRSPGASPDQALLNASAIDSILRPLVIDRLADSYVAGAAIVVVSGDRIVYKSGFGRREVLHEDPVRVDRTIWRLGSITKVLTGVATMQLVDRGLLRLDADVNPFLAEAKVPETFPQPVTLHRLLTHTAGFDQLGLNRHVRSREEVRPLGPFLAENLVRLRQPGELATYDTYGITLAGHLVERLSGMGYQVLSDGAVRQMLTRQFSNDAEQPGYGYTFWEDRSFGIPAYSHDGSMTGFGALFYLIPEHRIGVFVAYNQESSRLGAAVVSALVTSLFPGSAASPVLRAAYTANADISRFAGVYANAMHNHQNPDVGWRRRPFDVTVNEAGQIMFQNQRATRVGPLAFQRPDGVLVTFRENPRKEITHMFLNQDAFERIK